jgi:molecular chaperone GrpE
MSQEPKEEKESEEEDRLKKVERLEAALKDEKKKAETYLNQLKYARADLENLQKRMQRSIDEALDRANGRFLMQLLPVLDELDLAIEATGVDGGNVVEGIEMIRRKLWKLMMVEGVASIKAVGEPFDPRMHEAVLDIETSDYPDRTVIEEFRKGYLYRDRLLRASMVKVARNPISEEDQGECGDE